MKNPIILPSGNVVPALSEQEEYLKRLLSPLDSRRGWYKGKWTRTRHRKLRGWDISNSGESTFVQHGILPKEITEKEQSRRDWRKHKQFERDKKRHGSCRDGCPPWMKRMCNKAWRQWVRDCIVHENYDLIHTKTRKDFFDPWMWD